MRLLDRLDDHAIRSVSAARFWLLAPVAYAIAVGSAYWAWSHPESLSLLATNRVPWADRKAAVGTIGFAAALLFACYVGSAVIVRRFERKRAQPRPFSAIVVQINRSLVGLLAAPLGVWLGHAGIEQQEPIWTALLCIAAGVLVAASLSAIVLPNWGSHGGPEEAPRGWLASMASQRWVAPLCALAIALGYAWFFSRIAIANHHALNSRTIDLGYYDNIFYQSIHGRPLGCSFLKGQSHASGHYDPMLVLLSPLYLLYPRAELLLVLQSVWLGLGTIPAYLIAQRSLRSPGFALALSLAWALYPALHGANLYEFHSLTLIAPLLVWLLYFLEGRQWIGYGITLVLLWLCREDVPLVTCFVALYAVGTGIRPVARAGWITMLLSIAYFLVVKRFFMPSFDMLNSGAHSYSYAYYFSDLIPEKHGVKELFASILSNPIYLLQHVFANAKKILFLIVLFGPLALLPLFAKRSRIMLLYGLFITLAANREAVYSTHFQYSCLIFPIAFAIAPLAVARIRDGEVSWLNNFDRARIQRGLAWFLVVGSVLFSWKFGALVQNTSFRGGFARVTRELSDKERDRYRLLRELVARIPPDASVVATNSVGPHISNREKAYLYSQRKTSDYVLVNRRELRDWVKTWHRQRVASGGLVKIGGGGDADIVLYRVDPAKDVSAPARRAGSAAGPKNEPSPPEPTTPADDDGDVRERLNEENGSE